VSSLIFRSPESLSQIQVQNSDFTIQKILEKQNYFKTDCLPQLGLKAILEAKEWTLFMGNLSLVSQTGLL